MTDIGRGRDVQLCTRVFFLPGFLIFSRAVKMLYHAGLVVEPSGAAAFAALLSKKVPNSAGRNIVVFITGGNITPEELFHLM